MARFKFRFRDARTWRYMMASVEKILDEGVFVVSDDGLRLRALDTSHIAMVDLHFPPEAFDEWEAPEGEFSFGVSFKEFTKVLRRATKEDSLVLEVDEARITVIFHSLGRGRRVFKIPQIALTYERLGEPKVEYTVHARMLGSTFRDMVKDLEVIGEALVFDASAENKLLARAEGDIEKGEVELSVDDGTLLDLEVESPDRSSYTMEYFSEMNSAAQAVDVVSIHYAEEAPVRVDMEYPGGGRLTFYVSPRID